MYLCCNRYYRKNIDEQLTKMCAEICRFSSHDINKFILWLQKDEGRRIEENLMKLQYLIKTIFTIISTGKILLTQIT